MFENKVRIIAGKWRGRKITFPSLVGLRPTADRIRETLFNWLMNDIGGAVCLDLFAGSGALGFEALSRGAKHVTFVDSSAAVISALKENSDVLQINNCKIVKSDFLKINFTRDQKFNIVFLDPPFRKNFVIPAIDYLIKNNLLDKNALVYIEMETNLLFETIDNFEVVKQCDTSNFHYFLLRFK